MQPFDGAGTGARVGAGDSGLQQAYDARRLDYLERIIRRAYLHSDRFSRWVHDGHPDATLCDAVSELGVDALDPGLEMVQRQLEEMSADARNAAQRSWLLTDDRETALARALLVRADPSRQDDVFGWDRAGVGPDEYWARLVPSPHMTYLLETADFGANEILRLVYMLDAVPEHLATDALLWRDEYAFGRDPNYPDGAAEAVHASFLAFKYWWDDPFRCDEFTGHALEVRSSKALNGHEDMTAGQDMTYWSENHRLLFATAEYLAGQFWPDEQFVSQPANRKGGPAVRPGDLTGRQHMAHAKRRVVRWLDERLRMGFSEWNAPGYYVEDLLPLVNLADFVVDREIRTKAAMVLDLLALDVAVHGQSGAFAGSAGRAYFEHKNCVWEQSMRDPAEILFGRMRRFVGTSNAAVFLATSPSYRPPDAISLIARSAPSRFSMRGRSSITFDEGSEFGVGTRTEDDMEFWWSRAAYATKQTIVGSREVAAKNGLLDTPPFKEILPLIESVADKLDTAEGVGAGILGGVAGAVAGFAVAGPVGALVGAAAGATIGQSIPDVTQEDAADIFSVITEGSVLSRSNIVSHQTGGATLASVQNYRRGQINFQSLPCVAALPGGAMVWTSYPSAGTRLTFSLFFGLIEVDEEIFKGDSHDGPNWWTGNAAQPRVVQKGAAAITAYDAQAIQKLLFGDRTHAWFPKNQFDDTRGPVAATSNHDTARWFFGRAGESYVGLFSARGTDWTADGPWKDKEIRADGDTNVFITQIGSPQEFGDFERFVAQVSRARVHVSGLHTSAQLECSYDVPNGERLELHYDDGPRYGGDPLQDDGFPRHLSPFARVAWRQDRYAIQHGARSLVHDIPHARRTTSGQLSELVHDTPLEVYGQNMALLPGALYKGVDRDAAVDHLIDRLAERRPDVVGLSEMWTSGARSRVTEALRTIYPYFVEGPHEDEIDVGPVEFELMGGGLLLLSRHPIVASAQTVYRQSSGDDGLTNKGALHARIQPVGHPCGVDVFLTHTQAPHPTVLGSTAGARQAVRAQLRHLGAFIAASRDPDVPAVLMGDFNVDFFGHRDLYDEMIASLRDPIDVLPAVDTVGARRPMGTSESDDGSISSFHDDHDARAADDPARFGSTIERLDYILLFPGVLYSQHVAMSAVVVEQWEPGRDMSDHYGVRAGIDTTTQRLPRRPAGEVVVSARIRRVSCLRTTSGPGSDEVSVSLDVLGAWGARVGQSTGDLDDLETGQAWLLDLEPVVVNASDELVLRVSGVEIDNLSADDSLGSSRREFDLDAIAGLADGFPRLVAMPVLRGGGGEYVIDVELTIAMHE